MARSDDIDDALDRAWASAEQDDFATALAIVEAQLEKDPQSAKLHVYHGRFCLELAQFERAEASYKKAIELQDRLFPAWTELGSFYRDLGEYRKSASCLEMAAGIRGDQYVYTLLADVMLHFDVDGAVVNARRALAFDPNWEEADDVLQQALRKQREDEL